MAKVSFSTDAPDLLWRKRQQRNWKQKFIAKDKLADITQRDRKIS
jgi:hypothetical protein